MAEEVEAYTFVRASESRCAAALSAELQMPLSPQAFADLAATNPMEAIRVLARDWLSIGSEPFSGHRIVDGAPASLRWLHREELAVASQNQWVSPDELAAEDGRLVFYVENQGVCVWATAPSEANGPMWVQDASEEMWREESPALDGFLLQAMIFETVAGAPWGGLVSWCEKKDALKVCATMTRLTLAPTARLGELYAGEDLLMTRVPNGDGDTLWIGARTQAAEDRVRGIADLDW